MLKKTKGNCEECQETVYEQSRNIKLGVWFMSVIPVAEAGGSPVQDSLSKSEALNNSVGPSLNKIQKSRAGNVA